jgi:mannitol/fructose-specific phosphotransferase system IIA component (Ntr-type)
MTIALADILKERQVVAQLKSRRMSNSVRELIDVLATTEKVRQPDQFFDQVISREQASSTLAENGVAFPHARTELVEEIALAVGRSRAGIPWNAEGERSCLIFLVAVPRQLVNDYLVVVGKLARITRDEEKRKALLNATSAAEIVAMLLEAPSL